MYTNKKNTIIKQKTITRLKNKKIWNLRNLEKIWKYPDILLQLVTVSPARPILPPFPIHVLLATGTANFGGSLGDH